MAWSHEPINEAGSVPDIQGDKSDHTVYSDAATFSSGHC